MVTIQGLIRTFKVAKNPHALIKAKITHKKVNITLFTGKQFNLSFAQFRFLRDNYELVKKYHVEQVNGGIYKYHLGTSEIVGSPEVLLIVEEILSGIYDYDFKNKIVLDIGGFEGESAVFFWSLGAKKVIIYEPVLNHKNLIEENIRLNNINAEVHVEGIGEKDNEIKVYYENTDNCFGLQEKQQISANQMVIKIRDITTVLSESNADVAKIDCEGAEISLTKVPREVLRKVEYYIIEVHSPEIKQALVQKFSDTGYLLAKDIELCEMISLLHFKRNHH
ncbi:MAG: FkbM family methyltransferase [Candidatus Bathyarchaeia archaeon]